MGSGDEIERHGGAGDLVVVDRADRLGVAAFCEAGRY